MCLCNLTVMLTGFLRLFFYGVEMHRHTLGVEIVLLSASVYISFDFEVALVQLMLHYFLVNLKL